MKQAWPLVELGTVLHQVDRAESSISLGEINLAGVYGFGKGLFERGPLVASTTSYKSYNRLVEGDFVISQPKAWEGAIAAVTEQFNGWYLSPVFPAFRPDENLLSLSYLHWYCQQPFVWDQLKFLSTGMGARRETVSPKQFLSLKIPLPPLETQQKITARIDTVQRKIQAADKLRASIDQDIASLLAVQFQETLKHATWLPLRKAAPIVRREVTIASDSSYSEVGVRSFFKGAFVRRTVVGDEFTWQKLYQIKADDLIFSNIMAWEKAIALAGSAHDKCVGNHRMLTCEASPEMALPAYLHYYFTTDEGFNKVYAASPGTAARNRTLTADALMAIEVPLPSLVLQKKFVKLKYAMEQAAVIRANQMVSVEAMLPALSNQLLS